MLVGAGDGIGVGAGVGVGVGAALGIGLGYDDGDGVVLEHRLRVLQRPALHVLPALLPVLRDAEPLAARQRRVEVPGALALLLCFVHNALALQLSLLRVLRAS